MRNYETLSQATDDLAKRGYTLDFNLTEEGLLCDGVQCSIADFVIVEFYRFEGFSSPDDLAVVYALERADGGKGVLVTGYGISADGPSAALIKGLKFKDGMHPQ